MTYDLLINGEMNGGSGQIHVIDPATGQVFAQCARATKENVEAAVSSARKAFGIWSYTQISERRDILQRVADIIDENATDLARLLTHEQGKPLAESSREVSRAAAIFRFYAAFEISNKIIEDGEQRRVEQQHVPLGVIAAIVPWNFPLFMAAAKIAPALLMGNTVILKPAPTTPITTLHFGRLVRGIVPPGVLNILADDNDMGPLLTSHPGINKVAFTGSVQTGMKVMSSVASTMKRLTLELGGNDAGLVLDDCDPLLLVDRLYKAAFSNNGQICVAMKRLYVPDSLYDQICEEFSTLLDKKVVGSGFEEGVDLGPVQNKAQFDKIKSLIESSGAEGKIIAGGVIVDRPGYFIRPTLVRDIAEGSALVDQEQFGPILPILRYVDIEDAISRVNATQFGLGNSVWSPNIERAKSVAARLDCGTVWINKHGEITPDVPFCGAKMSGIGCEYAMEGLSELAQIKIINLSNLN